jgi:hypothetical protein
MFLLAVCGDHLRGGQLLVDDRRHRGTFSQVPIAFGLSLLCIGLKPIFAFAHSAMGGAALGPARFSSSHNMAPIDFGVCFWVDGQKANVT